MAQEVHIIGNSHGADPEEVVSLVGKLGLKSGDLYFDELKEGRWRNPASIPPLQAYLESLRDHLSDVDASVVPMGHDDLLYATFRDVRQVHACQPAEDVYMVEHVVVPKLREHPDSKAVIHLGYIHMPRFTEELRKNGYEPQEHTACDRVPQIDWVLALRDFAEGRSDTYLDDTFIPDFFMKACFAMGERYMSPETAMGRFFSGDPEFVAKFNYVAPDIFNDKKFHTSHRVEPNANLGKVLRDTYASAKDNCDSMRTYAVHPVIPAKSL